MPSWRCDHRRRGPRHADPTGGRAGAGPGGTSVRERRRAPGARRGPRAPRREAPERPDRVPARRRKHLYLSDFGLTKSVAATQDVSGSGPLTMTGFFVGTPEYAAPEQIESKEIDGRTDQYALGCELFQAHRAAAVRARREAGAVAHLMAVPRVTEVSRDSVAGSRRRRPGLCDGHVPGPTAGVQCAQTSGPQGPDLTAADAGTRRRPFCPLRSPAGAFAPGGSRTPPPLGTPPGYRGRRSGRVAQRESARLTRERSMVQIHPRPPHDPDPAQRSQWTTSPLPGPCLQVSESCPPSSSRRRDRPAGRRCPTGP